MTHGEGKVAGMGGRGRERKSWRLGGWAESESKNWGLRMSGAGPELTGPNGVCFEVRWEPTRPCHRGTRTSSLTVSRREARSACAYPGPSVPPAPGCAAWRGRRLGAHPFPAQPPGDQPHSADEETGGTESVSGGPASAWGSDQLPPPAVLLLGETALAPGSCRSPADHCRSHRFTCTGLPRAHPHMCTQRPPSHARAHVYAHARAGAGWWAPLARCTRTAVRGLSTPACRLFVLLDAIIRPVCGFSFCLSLVHALCTSPSSSLCAASFRMCFYYG